MDEVLINGIAYVPKQTTVQNSDNQPYVIARTYSAGVFAGFLKSRNGKEVELLNARRIWKWSGAASLSQLAVSGTSKPTECKFPCEVPSVILTEVVEILPTTNIAYNSIKEVTVWHE